MTEGSMDMGLLVKRRAGEAVLIGDDIRVEVVQTGPARAELHVEAPPMVSIDREEVRLAAECDPPGILEAGL